VHKWGISCTGSLGVRQFGVKRSVFLHKVLSGRTNSNQLGYNYARKGFIGKSESEYIGERESEYVGKREKECIRKGAKEFVGRRTEE